MSCHEHAEPRLATLEVARHRVEPPIAMGTMREWARQGRFPTYKPGRRVLVDLGAFDAFLRGSPVQPETK